MKINRVGFSKDDHEQDYETIFPWDHFGVTKINGGSSGIVLGGGVARGTAFFEFSDDRTGFLRGEGSTLEDAEEQAWFKFQRIIGCPSSEHDYIPGKHTDGSGMCRFCNHHGRDQFTAAELGQFCYVCQAATFTKVRAGFVCDTHHPAADKIAALNALSSTGVDYLSDFFTLLGEIEEAGRA